MLGESTKSKLIRSMLKKVPITPTIDSNEFEEIVELDNIEEALHKMKLLFEELKENGDKAVNLKGFGIPF